MLMQSCSLRCNDPILQWGQNTTPTQALHLSHHSNTSLCDIRIRVIPIIPPSASPFSIQRKGWCPLEGFVVGFISFSLPLSLRLHIIGFGENPTCTNPPTSKIFINLLPFGDNMTKICYILRGLPGTGKSLLSQQLQVGWGYAKAFSTDDYFMVNGEYQFDPSKLGEYHQKNLNEADDYMKRFKGEEHNHIMCIIDNTNTQHWEYEKYIQSAENNGFMVQIISIDWDAKDIPLYAKRNSHGVPEEAIYRMAARWEY